MLPVVRCSVVGGCLLIACLAGAPSVAQPLPSSEAIPIGSWRTHLSYQDIQHLAITPERVYGAATNGLFYLAQDDRSVQLLSKNDGLNDAGVVALAYEPSLNALMLAYRSSRIDVLIDQQIISFSLIQEANQDRRESIYGIHWQGDRAFLSTSNGVRVLVVEPGDSPTVRIQESYTQLGTTGTTLAIFDATVSRDSIFLATAEGIIANGLTPAINRQDFNSWLRFTDDSSLPKGTVHHVASYEGKIYAAWDGQGVFGYQAGRWQPTSLVSSQSFHSLRATPFGLIAAFGNQVATLDSQGKVEAIQHALITKPQDAAMDEQGVVWVADQRNGLLRGETGTFASFVPNGPPSDNISQIKWINQRMVALANGFSDQLSVFNSGQWSSVLLPSVPTRLTDIVFSQTTRSYYLSSRDNGLTQWDGEQEFNDVMLPDGNTTDNQITSLAIQREALWVARSGNESSLLALSLTDGTWRTFGSPLLRAVSPQRLVIDRSGYQWMTTGASNDSSRIGSDLLVFDEQEEQVQAVRPNVSSADLPGTQITDLVVDRNGLVWIGGDQGIAYFPNPFGIFSEVSVVKPVFDRQFLLRDEEVTSLSVDGGNRKWVGTRNGLWLFSDTGEDLIHHFTTANSPLISNTILDIAINDNDGEVFVATDQGIVSYRGTATHEAATHEAVKVFPNPIRQGFDGTVGIQGLATDATVKVTTVSGTFVQTLQAQGGTATWDVHNYAGQRVSPGVYLLFSATADGEETYVGKMAIIP